MADRHCRAAAWLDFLCCIAQNIIHPHRAAGAPQEADMTQGFDSIQKFSKDAMDAGLKTFESSGKNMQAIATQVADYSKASFEQGQGLVEKLMGAKSFDKALEIQSAYAKTAYEGFVAHATKLGELYTAMAKEAVKPLETVIPKAAAK
jgi:hypothetical protein